MTHAYRTLREYIEQTGATQAEIALAVGATQTTISRIVRGRRQPSLDLAERLSRTCHIPIESLIVAPRGGDTA